MLSSKKAASNCRPAAIKITNEMPITILTNKRNVTPIPTASGRNARFFPSRICLRGVGSRTSCRKPPRSKPNKLYMSWLKPRNINTTAPVAESVLRLSLMSAERRTKIIVPKIRIIKKFVPSIIFTSGARVRQRKKAIAEAMASSGTPGICLSMRFFPFPASFSTLGLRLDFLPAVCPW